MIRRCCKCGLVLGMWAGYEVGAYDPGAWYLAYTLNDIRLALAGVRPVHDVWSLRIDGSVYKLEGGGRCLPLWAFAWSYQIQGVA
jgi:hypothetical protein